MQGKTQKQNWFKRLIAKYDEFLKDSGLDQKGGCGCMPPARYDPPLYTKEEKIALKQKKGK